MKKYLLAVCGLICTMSNLKGQWITFDQYKEAADEAFHHHKDFHNAEVFYSEALRFDPKDSIRNYVTFQIAESAYHSWQLHKAEKFYKIVIDSVSNRCTNNYFLAEYNLGRVYQRMGNYKAAINSFNKFRSITLPECEPLISDGIDVTIHLDTLAQNAIEALNWAVEEKVNEKISFKALSYINECNQHQVAPVLYNNDLLFTAKSDPDDCPDDFIHYVGKLYSADTTNRATSVFREEMSYNRGDTSIGFISFNRNKSRVYYSVCYNINTLDTHCKIVSRGITGDSTLTVEEREELGSDKRNDPSYTHPNVGWDTISKREILYYVSDKKGGKGGLDIWYAPIANGEVQRDMQVTLNDVNSSYDEVSPFYNSKTATLFFSSNREDDHRSFGGFDVYKSENYDFDVPDFQEIDILDQPINTNTNEIFYVEHERMFWFSSNRVDSLNMCAHFEPCCYNIFEGLNELSPENPCKPVYRPVLADYCSTITPGGFANDVKMEFYEMDTTQTPWKRLKSIEINADRNFPVKQGKTYRLLAFKPGYEDASLDVKVDKDECDLFSCYLYLKRKKIEVLVLVKNQCAEETEYLPLTSEMITITQNNTAVPGKLCSPHSMAFYVDPWVPSKLTISDERYDINTNNNFVVYGTREKCDTIHVVELNPKPYQIELASISLYFDNDIPGPHRSTVDISDRSYIETWMTGNEACDKPGCTHRHTGYGTIQREVFYQSNVDPGNVSSVHDFFAMARSEKLKYDNLKKEMIKWFCAHDSGVLTLDIEGHASPLFSSNYNLHLSRRRINSIEQDIGSHPILSQALDEGRLIMVKGRGKGEIEGRRNNVSGDSNKKNLSIYHPDAAKSRRVTMMISKGTSAKID